MTGYFDSQNLCNCNWNLCGLVTYGCMDSYSRLWPVACITSWKFLFSGRLFHWYYHSLANQYWGQASLWLQSQPWQLQQLWLSTINHDPTILIPTSNVHHWYDKPPQTNKPPTAWVTRAHSHYTQHLHPYTACMNTLTTVRIQALRFDHGDMMDMGAKFEWSKHNQHDRLQLHSKYL